MYLPDTKNKKSVPTIHLQGIGKVEAKRADMFKKGEKFVWNYGSTSTILGIKKTTPKQIVFKTQTNDKKIWERRLKKNRLVGMG